MEKEKEQKLPAGAGKKESTLETVGVKSPMDTIYTDRSVLI